MNPRPRSMPFAKGATILLLAALLGVSCGNDDAAAAPPKPLDDRAAAEQQFETFCVTCHGKDGKGDGPAAATLDPKPRNWTDKTWQAAVDDDRIRKVIREGGASVGLSPLMVPNPIQGRPGVIDRLVEIVRSYGK